MKYNEENQVKGRLNAAAVATIVTSSQPPAYGDLISTMVEASTPSVHSVTTTSTINNAITPASSSMKLPIKRSLRKHITPPKRFVARPSKFGLKKVDGDRELETNEYPDKLSNMPSDKIDDSLMDIETDKDEDLSVRISKYLSPEYQGEKQAEEQPLKVDSDDEPYIGSRYPSSIKQSRVVSSTDYYRGCNLRGAHPLPGSAKFKSIIFYEGSRYSLGKYEFVSDAALAYDKAALSIGPYWDINFASWDEYIATRTLEVMRKGSDQVDLTSVLEEISSRASEVVSKVLDEAELNDTEWVSFVLFVHIICSLTFLTSGIHSVTVKNQQSIGSTASDSHDERVKAYESARALFLSMKEKEYHVQEKVYACDQGCLLC